jgi:fucose 4-O-acetylase-like acetyltransferase
VPGITLVFGVLLIVLGLGAFVATGSTHKTALIPAYAGALFVILGLLARNAARRKHVMHAAAALALLGFLGTARGLFKAFRLLGGATVERPEAVIAQAIMGVLCVAFVLLCVNSFVQARKNRDRAAAGFEPTIRA